MSLREMTRDNQADRALFESEQRFRMLVQGVRDYAIYMLDREGRITNWNSGAEAIKGYREEEIVGQHFSRFYTEEDRANGEPARALATALREGKYEREAWRVRKDGSLFWAHVLIDPIFDESGRHVGFAKVTRDATESKRAHDELETTRAALAQAQKLQAIGELAGGIAHDFNNLITVIGGSADFLLKNPDLPEEKKRQHLSAILEMSERAKRLTSHLLAFGRRQPIKPQVIDLNARLRAFAEMLARTLGGKIALELELGAGECRVEADVAQLDTAILNAVVNARDAMPAGGTLVISTGVEPDEGRELVRLAIRDTGLGMPQRVLDHAFEPFFTTKEIGKGTGLGLSQIHGFAAQAGGRAEIQSNEGGGTTLSILLPRSGEELSGEPAENSASAIPPKLKVLLVEDNEPVRAFARSLLDEMGCEVTAVADARSAIGEFARDAFDLVVTDVALPGMSGVELARQLQRTGAGVPILLTSGYSEELLRERSLPMLPKPYNASDLRQAIAAVLGRASPPSAD